MRKISIGGEFFFSPSILFSKKKWDFNAYFQNRFSGKEVTFTAGGYYSILGILSELELAAEDEILLPAYLCHTILYPLERLKIKYSFYNVDKHLTIDLKDLISKITSNTKAIYYIEYFGQPPSEEIISSIKSLCKQRQISLIQDLAQSIFAGNAIEGDFAFSSLRKFLPVDLSAVISERKLKSKFLNQCYSYNFLRVAAQFLRYLHINFNIGRAAWFLRIFKYSDKAYYQERLFGLNSFNRFLFTRYDLDSFATGRLKNAEIIYNALRPDLRISPFDITKISVGIPILVKNRDALRKQLISKNIFCPVHWPLHGVIDFEKYPDSKYLTDHLLTIPVREDYTDNEMQFLIKNINELINAN